MAECDQPAVPAAGRRQADDDHAARRLPGRSGRRGGVGARAAWPSISACGAMARCRCCSSARRRTATPRPTARVGFGPTRRAISRIAKEGRKYGVFLGLVTQRPAELDPTIISQCSTLFAMRMSNDRDQALLRSAVSDAAANLFCVRAFARHPRGAGLRRRRAAADAADIHRAAATVAAEERGVRQTSRCCTPAVTISTSSPRWSSAGAARP